MISAILFDLDDTLYDRAPIIAEWARRFAAAHLGLPDDVERQEAERALIALDGRGYVPKAMILARIKAQFPAVELDLDTFNAEFYDCFLSLLILDPITDRFLALLGEKGLPFGIVTNGTKRQWLKTRRLGVDRLTSCIFVSEDFGVKKPDPSIFLAAAANLAVPVENILFIGDHPANDIGGANRTGMQTAWLHRNQPWPANLTDIRPDYTIGSLDELIPVLE